MVTFYIVSSKSIFEIGSCKIFSIFFLSLCIFSAWSSLLISSCFEALSQVPWNNLAGKEMFWVQDNLPKKLKVHGCWIIFWSNMKQTPVQSWESKDVYMVRSHSKPSLCSWPLLHLLAGKVLMQQTYELITLRLGDLIT